MYKKDDDRDFFDSPYEMLSDDEYYEMQVAQEEYEKDIKELYEIRMIYEYILDNTGNEKECDFEMFVPDCEYYEHDSDLCLNLFEIRTYYEEWLKYSKDYILNIGFNEKILEAIEQNPNSIDEFNKMDDEINRLNRCKKRKK